MSNQFKKEYLTILRLWHSQCKTRKGKSTVIDEVITNLKIVRKSAIRVLRKKIRIRRPARKPRKVIYIDKI